MMYDIIIVGAHRCQGVWRTDFEYAGGGKLSGNQENFRL